MSARAKIENLTNTWYGYAVFSSLAALIGKTLSDGFSLFSIIGAGIGLFFWLLLTFFIGRRLLNKGHLTRLILIGVSGFSTVMGAYGAAQASWMFVHAWELSLILKAAASAVSAWMMAKSFRVLTDASVKTYFA